MKYRICKSFYVESGHMLSKHPSLCRFPHGHTRRIDVVLASERLDDGDMVCDFRVVRLAIGEFVARFDHSLAINSRDPLRPQLAPVHERLVIFEDADPTTEMMARQIFEHLATQIEHRQTYTDADGSTYRFPVGVTLERVRVSETPTSWAEVSRD